MTTRHPDITMEEGNAQNVGQEKPSKKARIEQTSSSWEKTNGSPTSSNNKPEPDARQSPSIAALLDQPSPTFSPSSSTTTKQQQHFSPHATPPLAPVYESASQNQEHPQRTTGAVPEESSHPFPAPGYRPPSPASTPKGRRHSAQQINRTNNSNTTH